MRNWKDRYIVYQKEDVQKIKCLCLTWTLRKRLPPSSFQWELIPPHHHSPPPLTAGPDHLCCDTKGCWGPQRVTTPLSAARRKPSIIILLPPPSFMLLQPSKPDWKGAKKSEVFRYWQNFLLDDFLTNYFRREGENWKIIAKSVWRVSRGVLLRTVLSTDWGEVSILFSQKARSDLASKFLPFIK